MQSLGNAIRFLTGWGLLDARDRLPESLGRTATYLFSAGFVLGLLLALTNYLLQPHLDAAVLSLLVITLWIAVTGARNLAGMKESFAAFGRDGARPNDTAGFVAVVMIIFFKFAAAESMDEIATLSLFLTPVLARWALLVCLYGYGFRFDAVAGRLAEQARLLPLLLATAATLALVVYFLSRKGLWVALAVSICALLLRELFFRRRGAVSQDHLGATVEINEALGMVLLASL